MTRAVLCQIEGYLACRLQRNHVWLCEAPEGCTQAPWNVIVMVVRTSDTAIRCRHLRAALQPHAYDLHIVSVWKGNLVWASKMPVQCRLYVVELEHSYVPSCCGMCGVPKGLVCRVSPARV